MENEIWKPVKGFETRFNVSNHGRIMSINGRWKGERLMECAIDSTGYRSLMMRSVNGRRCCRVHNVVAETFISDKPTGKRMTVNHKDGDKLNNHVSNLEWMEAGDNVRHAVKNGLLSMKGEKHFNRKLNNEQVYDIKFVSTDDNYTLANKLNVSREQVRDIRLGKCWSHITKDYPINSSSASVGV